MDVIFEENDLSELTASVTEKPVVVVTKAQQKILSDLVAVLPPMAVVIGTNEEYSEAGARLVVIKANIKQIDAIHDEIAAPLDDAMAKIKVSVTKLKAFFNVPKQRLIGAEVAIKAAMNVYLTDQNAKRAAAQKLLDEAAAKERARVKALADAAAKKAADEIAAARQRETELKAKIAKDAALAAKNQADLIAKGKVAAAAAAKVIADQKAQLAAADAAVEAARADKLTAGASVRADIAAAKIASLDAPKVAMEAPKAVGTTNRNTWRFEILHAHMVPREFLMVSEDKLRAAVKTGIREINGVRIFEHSDVVMTGK